MDCHDDDGRVLSIHFMSQNKYFHRTERRRREVRCEIFTTPELVTARRSILGPPAKGRPRPSKSKLCLYLFIFCTFIRCICLKNLNWICWWTTSAGLAWQLHYVDSVSAQSGLLRSLFFICFLFVHLFFVKIGSVARRRPQDLFGSSTL